MFYQERITGKTILSGLSCKKKQKGEDTGRNGKGRLKEKNFISFSGGTKHPGGRERGSSGKKGG